MLIAIDGIQGMGKTLAGVVYTTSLSLHNKVPLYCNLHLKGVSHTFINSLEELKAISHGIVLLDEVWLSLDSRSAMTKMNKEFTYWLQQTRKKDLMVFYTTQNFGQVDLRLRLATHWIIRCNKQQAGIWLSFINAQNGLIGRRMLLSEPARFYSLYDTYEVLAPFDLEASAAK